MTKVWTDFVQINIYNHSLLDMRARGVDLPRLLNGLGFEDVWITEGKACGPNVENSRMEQFPDNQRNITKNGLGFEDVWMTAGKSCGPNMENSKMEQFPENQRDLTEEEEVNVSGQQQQQVNALEWMMVPVKNEVQEFAMVDEISMETIHDEEVEKATNKSKPKTKKPNRKKCVPRKPRECPKQTSSTDPKCLSHNVACQFDDCDCVISWRVRAGKVRLLDHALYHFEEKLFKCDMCDVDFVTSRSYQHHFAKIHPEIKLGPIGLKNIKASPEALKALWEKCFSEQLDLVGTLRLEGDDEPEVKRSRKS